MTGGKILIDRAVLEQALEALTNCYSTHGHRCNRCDSEVDEGGNVAAELRAALDQPQPLPSPVWRLVPTTMTNAMAAVDKELRHTVPWIRWEAILAAAPQSPIQPLTDQQIHDCFQHRHRDKATERRMITRAIEEAIWKKNS